MLELAHADMARLLPLFQPERPGWTTIGPHVLDTGNGRAWVDWWPDPRAVLVQTGDNYVLRGEPDAFRRPPPVAGFVDAPPGLLAAYERVGVWDRVEYLLDGPPHMPGGDVRRLGPDGLAASGHAWGAFDGARLASVACTFFRGRRYEELGVVTEPAYDGRGLATACAARLCEDVRECGHVPSWSTSPDNVGSRRVAEKIGFRFVGAGRLYAVNVDVPGA